MSSALKTGALYLLLGEALLAVMGAVIKHLSDTLSTEQIVFVRNLTALLVLLPLLWRTGFHTLKTTCLHWHILRGLVGISAMYCYFWALGHLALTEAFLVKLTGPLFMPILAWWWLKEPMNPRCWLALIVGFMGVVLTLNPDTHNAMNQAAVIALAGAILAALAKVTIRRMSATENSQTIVFYFALIGTFITAPAALLNWQPIALDAWLWVLMLGVVATLGQLALTQAYRIAPTGKVGVYVYSAVIYGGLMGWLIWDEVPTVSTWAGGALIICAGLINLRGWKLLSWAKKYLRPGLLFPKN